MSLRGRWRRPNATVGPERNISEIPVEQPLQYVPRRIEAEASLRDFHSVKKPPATPPIMVVSPAKKRILESVTINSMLRPR